LIAPRGTASPSASAGSRHRAAVRRGEIDCDLVELRAFHFRGDRALPDQLVEFELVVGERVRDLVGAAQ
jgi:hypothetical protein